MGANRLCIAGYMGAGKSTVARILAAGRSSVIDADGEAKRLMNDSAALRHRIVEAFGPSVEERGAISFGALGRIVFGAEERLARLNAIVHPPLLLRLRELVDLCGAAGCVLDAALAPLWSVESWFDGCLWVEARREIRLRRVLDRTPALGKEDVLGRMRMQERLMAAPAAAGWKTVANNGTLGDLEAALATYRHQ